MAKKSKNKEAIHAACAVLARFHFEDITPYEACAYAIGKELNVRVDVTRGVIEFGIVKTFDRWANSTDYFYRLKNYDEAEFEKAISLAFYALKTISVAEYNPTLDLNDIMYAAVF